MTDGIIKGNGNSRYLKTVADALTLYPTYQDFMAAFIAGTLPVDLNGINAEGWRQIGTALNKGNLLTDETAAMFGLGQLAVPDDVLSFLGKYNQHWWKRRTNGIGEWEYIRSSDRSAYPDSGIHDGIEYQYVGIPFDNAVTAPKIETGSYVGTGTYGAANPNSLTFGFEPKLVIVFENSNAIYPQGDALRSSFIWAGQPNTQVAGGNTHGKVDFTVSGNTLSWYTTKSQYVQLNGTTNEGHYYKYLAIG